MDIYILVWKRKPLHNASRQDRFPGSWCPHNYTFGRRRRRRWGLLAFFGVERLRNMWGGDQRIERLSVEWSK